ncbi:LacI family transcriptional regulator [Brevibacterium sanguinis]|uniref:LacI family transcriptional regulator n=2 Tax=Brevibacterium TaxID=1696 RepID=A0A366IGC6_9MICO|nr:MULTISPECIES: LacI family DNA-binding transcriptional regulator [Brevibacterium]RBP61971.1 LacI family transcriptional regulator [Brevibacterium sanguinis]RBP70607.1 LacI family transcriptional regulator [Brevibacterium celere]
MGSSSRPQRATIADVARAAGVSRTTVSHALNGLGKVNPSTRAKVEEVAAALNYRPSSRARGLRSGRTQALALLSSMPSAVSAGPSQLGFFTELAMGCARTALLRDYVFVLAPPGDNRRNLDHLDVDGALVLEPAPGDPLLIELRDRGIPFVVIDGPAEVPAADAKDGPAEAGGPAASAHLDNARTEGNTPVVDLHHTATAELMISHLRERGSAQPSLLVGASGRHAQQAAIDVYRRFAAASGFTPLVAEVAESEGEAGAARAAARLLGEHPEIDGICVPIDAFATGAVRAAAEAGRRIGTDLLVATRYDGIRARTSVPPLTAVDLHLEDVAAVAVDRLIAVLEGAGETERAAEALASAAPLPTLIVRESTGG